jgi:hypothetical protein
MLRLGSGKSELACDPVGGAAIESRATSLLYTPWMPRLMQHHPYLNLADNVFELRVGAAPGVTLNRLPTDLRVISESAVELVVAPEHRRTIAAEVQAGGTQ